VTKSISRVEILSPEFHADPYAYFTHLREADPLHYEPELGAYFVSRYADVEFVLDHPDQFTTEALASRAQPVMRGVVLAQMQGREHTAKRKIVVRGFTGEILREHQAPHIRANAVHLLAPYLPIGEIDLVNDFGKTFAIWVTLDVLGLPKTDHEQIRLWHHGVADFITSIKQSPEAREHSLACSQALEDYLVPVIEERQRHPGPDLISTLCQSDFDGHRMSTSQILALILNVLLAATEPADKTLALLVHHLLDNPEQMRDVRADPSLLTAAIAETLRYTPPVQLIPRQLAQDTWLVDRMLPAGTIVFCLIGAANRDPSAFTDPDRFDIHRTDLGAARSFTAAARHLAFGTGMHACVGAAFARTEIEIVAQIVLDQLHDLRPTPGRDYAETGLYTRGPEALHLTFTPTSRSA
jgi:pulcherriminic acid synthase